METYDKDQSGELEFTEFVEMFCCSEDFKLKLTPEVKAEIFDLARGSEAEMLMRPESAVARRQAWKTEHAAVDLINDLKDRFRSADETKSGSVTTEQIISLVQECYDSEGTAKDPVEIEAEVAQAMGGEGSLTRTAWVTAVCGVHFSFQIDPAVKQKACILIEEEEIGVRKADAVLCLQAATRGFSAREEMKQVAEDGAEQLERLVELFQEADEDESGSLNDKELALIVKTLYKDAKKSRKLSLVEVCARVQYGGLCWVVFACRVLPVPRASACGGLRRASS